jgi:hypothetical protein
MGRILSAFFALSLLIAMTVSDASAAALSWTFSLDESRLAVLDDASGG